MAGRRVYGGSNPAVLIQDERMGPQAFEKLVASGSSTTRFHGLDFPERKMSRREPHVCRSPVYAL